MSELFLTVLNMSIAAGWLVLAVLLLRLLLKKAPRWLTVLLWGLVALRLICPFFPESDFSILPGAQTVSPEILYEPVPEIHSGIYSINSSVNPLLEQWAAARPEQSANPLQIWVFIAGLVWLAGVTLMLLYAAISFWRLRQRMRSALHLQENIYQSEQVPTPFVLGLFRPKIYLPSDTRGQDIDFIIAHERAHTRRGDHIWKPLGFLLLSLHWFNPLLWLGYSLLCRDIELACDEKVTKSLSDAQKPEYAEALLYCSTRREIIGCPLAFGGLNVKNRVKGILNYKKPAFWLVLVAGIGISVAALLLLTNPKKEEIFAGNTDTVTYEYRTNIDRAIFSLKKHTKEFSFSPSILSSALPTGTFEETEDSLILTTEDGKDTYIFYKGRGGLYFDAEKSGKMPQYRYAPDEQPKTCVPDKARFIKTAAAPYEPREYAKVTPVGEISPTFGSIIQNNLFRDVKVFENCLLKADRSYADETGQTVVHTLSKLDKYGNTKAVYTCRTDKSYYLRTPIATDDGGFLFALNFSDYATADGWASDKPFAAHIIKCDSTGKLQFDTPFTGFKGSFLHCYEKNGRFFLFGEMETPETATQGVGSPADVYMCVLDKTGKVLQTATIGGSDFDYLHTVKPSKDRFILSISAQSQDGDFVGSGSGGYPVNWDIEVDENLKVLKKKKASGRSFDEKPIGVRNGEPIYGSDALFKDFSEGSLSAYIEYGDNYLIVSENVTGVYEDTPPQISSMWYYTETVYSYYDKNGALLFRSTVDSSPDYDSAAAGLNESNYK